jgi:hypothetical protein
MLDKQTGYIRLNKFLITAEEFMKSMEDLQKQGLLQLVLDLRGNGGGFMNEAVDMADEFLDGDKLVVYRRATKPKKQNTAANVRDYWKKVNSLYWWMNCLPVPVKFWPALCRIGAVQPLSAAEHLEKDWYSNNTHSVMVLLCD